MKPFDNRNRVTDRGVLDFGANILMLIDVEGLSLELYTSGSSLSAVSVLVITLLIICYALWKAVIFLAPTKHIPRHG